MLSNEGLDNDPASASEEVELHTDEEEYSHQNHVSLNYDYS